jgi:hypothetical protein
MNVTRAALTRTGAKVHLDATFFFSFASKKTLHNLCCPWLVEASDVAIRRCGRSLHSDAYLFAAYCLHDIELKAQLLHDP